MSSLQYLEMVATQLPAENVEQTITDVLTKLSTLISDFIPSEKAAESKERMLNMLLQCLQNNQDDSIRGPIVDNMFSLIASDAHVALACSWLEHGHIHATCENPTASMYELKQAHKVAIVKTLHKLQNLKIDDKARYLDMVLADDKSDTAVMTRLSCMAASATPDVKAQVWHDLLSPDSKYSLYEKRALMTGFYSGADMDNYRMYAEKFYQCLPTLSQEHTYKFIETFFANMLPTLEIDDGHIVSLMHVKMSVADTNGMYQNVLQDAVERLLKMKRIREYSKQHS